MEFKELVWIFLINIINSAVIIGIFVFFIKKWLGLAIELRYKALEEKLKADIDKTQALDYLGKQNTIYPEIVEIIYRLRNLLREIKGFFPKDKKSWDNCIRLTGEKAKKYINNVEQFDKMLFVLTENLYKYKAFIDTKTFEDIHQYKRRMQDAAVIIDGLSRSPNEKRVLYMESNFVEDDALWSLFSVRLDKIYEEVDELHNTISNRIKNQLEKYIPTDE